MAYAIPTKDGMLRTLPVADIAGYVDEFVEYATAHPELQFLVTRVGCGLAGYKDEQIGPLFREVPRNCQMPCEWKKYVNDNDKET